MTLCLSTQVDLPANEMFVLLAKNYVIHSDMHTADEIALLNAQCAENVHQHQIAQVVTKKKKRKELRERGGGGGGRGREREREKKKEKKKREEEGEGEG